MSAQKKFDYDGRDFYEAIGNLASRDFNDYEIAMHIGEEVRRIIEERNNRLIDEAEGDIPELQDTDDIPDSLNPEVFSRMKNGNYDKWSEQENKLRSMLIGQALARARVKLNLLYKGVYDKLAMGKWKCKTTTTVEKNTVNKDGQPYTETVTTVTEQELPPNMQAISTWRFNHDPEFRKTLQQMKKMDVSVEDKTIDKINVNIVYNKKEDTELQEKK
jgi:hypothetical protein